MAKRLKTVSEAVVLPVKLEWTIKNFEALWHTDHPPLKSLLYSYKGMEIQLEVNRALGEGYADFFSVRFCLVSCTYSLPLWARYVISIVTNGKWRKYGENAVGIEMLQTYVGEEWEMDDDDFQNCLHNGQLTVRCNIWFTIEEHSKDISLELKLPDCDLKADFRSLLQDGKLSDVTLVAGGKTFPAHKLILSTRSPVFASMFEHDMKETATNEVNIADIEPSVLQEMLVYIYTDEFSSKDHKKLFYAADKYQLNRLKVLCENELSKTISVDNVTDCLLLADMHEAKQLKEKCVCYIIRNRSEVMKTPGWSDVAARNDLLVQLFQAATI